LRHKESSKVPLAVLLLFTVLGSTLVYLPAPVLAQVACGSTIKTNTILTANIGPCSGNGIVFGASGVTLDCAHHRITGDEESYEPTGILVEDFNRDRVENCVISDFATGVYLEGSNNVIVNNNVTNTGWWAAFGGDGFDDFGMQNQIAGNVANDTGGYGFIIGNGSTAIGNIAEWNSLDGFSLNYLCNASHNIAINNGGNGFTIGSDDRLYSNIAYGNGYWDWAYSGGFFMLGNASILTDNIADHNSYSGFYLSNASLNLLENNTANYNPVDGYTLDFGGGATVLNTLKQDIAIGNGYNGFDLSSAGENSLTGNIANSNVDGFYLQTSDANTMTQNTADDNNFSGFHISSSSHDALKSNTAVANKLYGFWLDIDEYDDGPSNYTALTENVAASNGLSGFFLNDSPSDSLVQNVAYHNGQDGFSLYSSSNNTLAENTADSNGHSGFHLHGSFYNTLTWNTANNNNHYGYNDSSRGSGTAGTANRYPLDECSGNGSGGSSPSGLCLPISTSTLTVSCSPASVAVYSVTICKATVTGDSPTGTVTLAQSGEGSVFFTVKKCTLVAGTCTATMTGSKVGTVVLMATYSGDSNNRGSSGTAKLTISKASTTTAISCSRSTFPSDSSIACTARVTGHSPAGIITWSKVAGTGRVSFSKTTCTLSAGKCSVIVKGMAAGSITIKATYGGDSNNQGSSGKLALKVS
jgi:parallel beta-helix repeat protein